MSGPPELKVYGVRGKSLKICFTLISYGLIVYLISKVFKSQPYFFRDKIGMQNTYY